MGSFSIVSPHDRLGQDASLMSNGAMIHHQLCFGPLDRTTISRAKPVCRPRPRLCHLCFAIAGRGIGHEEAEQLFAALVTWSTARSKAIWFALEGRVKPLSLRTNCSEEARISSSVAGGLKLWSVLILRHMISLLHIATHD